MKRMISEVAVRRLNLYYRFLSDLAKQGKNIVLSDEIAVYFNLDSSQVRKDMSFLGQLGKRGCGYTVETLLADIRSALRSQEPVNAILVGCGKLGSALLGYPLLREYNFNITGGFDIKKSVVGKSINGIPVYSYGKIKAFITSNNIRISIITAPKEHANRIVDDLIKLGIKGVLNFSPVFLAVRKGVVIKNVDFSVDFSILRYNLLEEHLI